MGEGRRGFIVQGDPGGGGEMRGVDHDRGSGRATSSLVPKRGSFIFIEPLTRGGTARRNES